MILLFWILNFAISWLNAWACGRTWNETKYQGGMAHFLNWCTAIMSACGFTWCYLVIMFLLGSGMTHETDTGAMEAYVTPEMLKVMFDLGFIIIYFPIIGSGLAMTINAWGHFLRKRTLANGVVTAWDTFAMIYNIRSGMQHLPGMFDNVGSFFKGDSRDSSKAIVLILVAVALIGGILTTWAIVKHTAKSRARDMAFRFGHLEDEARAAAA